jgi:hypothetical protein
MPESVTGDKSILVAVAIPGGVMWDVFPVLGLQDDMAAHHVFFNDQHFHSMAFTLNPTKNYV